MSALARYYHQLGMEVRGYDKTCTKLTEQLEAEGIQITYVDSVDTLDTEAARVVYTPAISADHLQLAYYRELGYLVVKRSEVLGELSQDHYTLAVAGTHGKTTTSSMLAYILQESGVAITAFLGGVLADYGTNLVGGQPGKVVVEADEYDRSFLTLRPDVAAIMSMDADHLDVYGQHGSMIEGFRAFSACIKRKGLLLMAERDTHHLSKSWQNELKRKGIMGLSFGIDPSANIQAHNIRVEDGMTVFDYQAHDNYIRDFRMQLPGLHNVENALVAITMAIYEGVPVDQISGALASFGGVKRRWERIVEGAVTYIDDYAHHPTELTAAIQAARSMYPGRHLTGIFQPHLYSRTRDFAAGFAEALDQLDRCLLLDIYPAREEPIEGVSSQMIVDHMQLDDKCITTKSDLIDTLRELDLDVILTLGAGDIDTCVPQIKAFLQEG